MGHLDAICGGEIFRVRTIRLGKFHSDLKLALIGAFLNEPAEQLDAITIFSKHI